MSDIESIRFHQEEFLAKEKARIVPVTHNVGGVEIKVNPGVFPPATDTRLLVSHLKTRPGERTLDLTTGSGSMSVIAGIMGASGVAVDINPLAVSNARENFDKYKVDMTTFQSDLYENVPDEKFDQVFANGPFFEGDITDPLDYACYGARKFLVGLLSGLKNHLKTEGKLSIVISEWSEMQFFKSTAFDNGLSLELVSEMRSMDGERNYLLFEVGISN